MSVKPFLLDLYMLKMSYFCDTYALIEIFNGNPNYEKFKEQGIYISLMNFYEFYYILLRDFNEKTAEYWRNKLDLVLIEITEEDVIEASKFRLKNIKKKLSFIDCLGYALALKGNIKFLTGDSKFENMKNIEFVK